VPVREVEDEDGGELGPLRLVHGHHLDRVLVRLGLHLDPEAGHDPEVVEEVGKPGLARDRIVLGRDPIEGVERGDGAGVVPVEGSPVQPGTVQHDCVDKRRQGRRLLLPDEPVDRRDELAHERGLARHELVRAEHGRPDAVVAESAVPVAPGAGMQPLDDGLGDTGAAHEPVQGDAGVARVVDDPEPGHDIPDLGEFEEVDLAAVGAGDSLPGEGARQSYPLVPLPAEDRDVAVPEMPRVLFAAGPELGPEQGGDLAPDERGLRLLVRASGEDDRLARGVLGPDRLLAPVRRGPHQSEGEVEDGRGGAVVAVEEDLAATPPGPLEVVEVREVRAAESVDRLVVVADDAEVVAGDELEKPELDPVGVLELVDEDVRVPLAVLVPDLGPSLQEEDGLVHHVRIVDEMLGPLVLLVRAVDREEIAETAGRLLVGPPLEVPGEVVGRDRLVAERADPLDHGVDHGDGVVADLDRREPEGVDLPEAPDKLVRLRDHARGHGDTRFEDVVAEDGEAEGVEGLDRDPRAGPFGAPVGHLLRRLLRVGEREHRVGVDPVLKKPGDLLGDDARLSRTRAGQDQLDAVGPDGLGLPRVQKHM